MRNNRKRVCVTYPADFGRISGWSIAARSVAALSVALLLAGCGQKRIEGPVEPVVWPPPPQPAVVEWVDVVRDSTWCQPASPVKRFFLRLAGSNVDGIGFRKPYGVAIDPRGRVFVTDEGHAKVAVFDKEGEKFAWLGGAAGPGALAGPTAITADARGHIFVTDSKQKRVVEYDPELTYVRAYGGPEHFSAPGGVAFEEEAQELWVLDVVQSDIHVFNLGGDHVRTVGKKGDGEGEFFRPTNLTIDGDRVYVSDTLNFRVQVVDLEGNYITQWGGNCNQRGCFQRAKGIDVDSLGNVYVVDAAFNNVQIFDPEGQLLLAFGGGGRDRGQLWLPAGMTIDSTDHIWVVSQYSWLVNQYKFVGPPPETDGDAASD